MTYLLKKKRRDVIRLVSAYRQAHVALTLRPKKAPNIVLPMTYLL